MLTSAKRNLIEQEEFPMAPEIRRAADAVKVLLVGLLKNLVGKPDELFVRWSYVDSANIIYFNVMYNPGDKGALIGPDGSHSEAVRDLLWAIGGKYKIPMRYRVG